MHRLLSDGTTVRKRRARHDDHDAVLRLYEEIHLHLYEAMSLRYLRLRFFTNSSASAEAGRRPRPGGTVRSVARWSPNVLRNRIDEEPVGEAWPPGPSVRL
ncbi:hypothetical protein [Streptomyces phaeochromogenes]